MSRFSIPDITCDACGSAITRAIRAEDPKADVRVDVHAREVDVTSALPDTALAAVIAAAGYTVAASV